VGELVNAKQQTKLRQQLDLLKTAQDIWDRNLAFLRTS